MVFPSNPLVGPFPSSGKKKNAKRNEPLMGEVLSMTQGDEGMTEICKTWPSTSAWDVNTDAR